MDALLISTKLLNLETKNNTKRRLKFGSKIYAKMLLLLGNEGVFIGKDFARILLQGGCLDAQVDEVAILALQEPLCVGQGGRKGRKTFLLR